MKDPLQVQLKESQRPLQGNVARRPHALWTRRPLLEEFSPRLTLGILISFVHIWTSTQPPSSHLCDLNWPNVRWEEREQPKTWSQSPSVSQLCVFTPDLSQVTVWVSLSTSHYLHPTTTRHFLKLFLPAVEEALGPWLKAASAAPPSQTCHQGPHAHGGTGTKNVEQTFFHAKLPLYH